MALTQPVAFSVDGRYLAHSTPDGTLKVWEVATGKLQQDYTPSAHLSATCTCLTWAPKRRTTSDSPKSKRKKHKVEDLDLVALGTTSGSVLVYSLAKGDLHTQLSKGHEGTVNCLSWGDSNNVYSCADDKHIVHWDVQSSSVKHKWKAGKQKVYSVCVCSGGRHLLSASRNIRLWDLHTHQELQRFTGHATEVFRLLHIPLPDTGQGDADPVNGSYFVSAALNDRLVNAWQISESGEKNSLASFSLPDEPVCLDLVSPSLSHQSMVLAVVTKAGQVLLYEHILNGRLKKPLKPKVLMQIASDTNKETPRPIPIICARVSRQRDTLVHIAHGTYLKPVIESLPYESLDAQTCLLREDTTKSVISLESSASVVRTPGVSKDMTVLAPGLMAPLRPSQDSKKDKKRKKARSEMTMEERMNIMSVGKPEQRPESEIPKADSLAVLLAQGLQSKDSQIINKVLQNSNEKIITNTVRRLPVPVIVPLVQELTTRMNTHAQSGKTLVQWTKQVLTTHTSYLMTFPELVEGLGQLYQMMDTRVGVFSRLSRLQGKLDLILSQVASQGSREEEGAGSQAAMLTYQDDSSDDGMSLGEMVEIQDSDDTWEDPSDVEVISSDSSGEEQMEQSDDSG